MLKDLCANIDFAKKPDLCNRERKCIVIMKIATRDNKEFFHRIERLFPRFGDKALDIPSWDEGKGMYLVEQYQAPSGNRSLTYVGVSDQLLLEITLGHFHSWEFVNKARAMVYDGEGFRVICSHDWEQSTHYRKEAVLPVITTSLKEYVLESGIPEGLNEDEVSAEINIILSDLFTRKVTDLDRRGARQILALYCKRKGVCADFTHEYNNDVL